MNISDEYEHLDQDLEYVLENILQEKPIDSGSAEEYRSIYDQYHSVLINKCDCSGDDDCSSKSKCHGGNYSRAHNSNELVLDHRKLQKENCTDIFYECSPLCKCDPNKCTNRLVQYGPRKHLKVIHSFRYNSKGLTTVEDIPSGGFICEYAGELLTLTEAKNRIAENESKFKMNFILCLNELKKDLNTDKANKVVTIVDPSHKGNIGRYLNHSCEPNCEVFSVRVDCPTPKVALFAKRHILAGEELCFHYGGEETRGTKVDKSTPCLCNSENCDKFMPSIEF